MLETPHARFSPSKLPRIIRCPGSVQLQELGDYHAQGTSAVAAEGTYLHEVTADYLVRDEYEVNTPLDKDSAKHAEYKDAVDTILAWCFALKSSLRADNIAFMEYIEHHVSLEHYTDFGGCGELADVQGTADWILETKDTLWVCDWKYGKGIAVDPDSEQLLAYAAGALNNPGYASRFKKVMCVIGQPRTPDADFKIHETTPDAVLEWVQKELGPALFKTRAAHPVLCPSDKACKWCDVKIKCRARYERAQATAEEIFKVHAQSLGTVSQEELKALLDQAPLLDQYIKDLTIYAFNVLQAGKEFPGYKLVRGRSIRSWDNEESAKEKLEERGFDVSALCEIKFWGPAKVEKAVGRKEAKEDWFLELIVKPEGKPTLVNEADKRPAIKFDSAEEIFAAFAIDEEAQE